MSFVNELQKKRNQLKETDTLVTQTDGQRYLVNKGNTVKTLQPCHGFIVDTKPDNIPALVTDYVYIGSQDCTASNIVESYNIRHVLSLGIDVETTVNQKLISCLDLPETDLKPIIAESLPFIRQAVHNRENILVHCNAGVSRTAMVAIAYLMQYNCMPFEAAYNLVKAKRPAIKPNDGFRNQLKIMKPGQLLK